MTDKNLIKKYNVAGPRYTSYPTVPYWDNTTFSIDAWKRTLSDNRVSIYIHLPYCESLCTFCACHKRITKNHAVENPYISAVLKEWELYVALLPQPILIEEIHLGGGTPSFFAPVQLQRLIEGILKGVQLADNYQFSWEGHPNNTTYQHLETLYNLGFKRVSFGVQDYDPVVQKAIHRVQPFENVARVTQWAREIGYTSISHDLVFGLPFQQVSSVKDTIEKTISLNPDRLAFYSYAHVPWIKGNGQRGFDENDLPSGEQKRALYELGLQLFEENGYEEVGMDHFALPHDELFVAMKEGTLHRNFMGYTTTQTKLMIGLGASSISDSWGAFAQNEKDVNAYQDAVEKGELPLFRGHILNDEDLFIRQQILNIMCRFETSWQPTDWAEGELEQILSELVSFQDDGLLTFNETGLKVNESGHAFVRNVCMVFDARLKRHQPERQLFSQTV